MDRHHLHELEAGSQRTAVVFQRNTAEVPLGNDEYLVATHGDNEDLLAALIRGRCFPYVCHGHTHRARDERIGEVRVICPGAITGSKHPAVPTVAILDTGSDTVEFHDMYHPGKPVPVGR